MTARDLRKNLLHIAPVARIVHIRLVDNLAGEVKGGTPFIIFDLGLHTLNIYLHDNIAGNDLAILTWAVVGEALKRYSLYSQARVRKPSSST